MLGDRENKSFIAISTIQDKFIENVLIKDDNKDMLYNTLKVLCTNLKNNNESIEEYNYFFKAESNIDEKEMNDTEKYCMLYTRKTGEQVVFINKTKKQIISRVKTLKMSMQSDAYEYASLFKMTDAISCEELLDIYYDDFVKIRRELSE